MLKKIIKGKKFNIHIEWHNSTKDTIRENNKTQKRLPVEPIYAFPKPWLSGHYDSDFIMHKLASDCSRLFKLLFIKYHILVTHQGKRTTESLWRWVVDLKHPIQTRYALTRSKKRQVKLSNIFKFHKAIPIVTGIAGNNFPYILGMNLKETHSWQSKAIYRVCSSSTTNEEVINTREWIAVSMTNN